MQIYEYISVIVTYCLPQETLCVKRPADIAFNSSIVLSSDGSSSDGSNSPNPNPNTRARLTFAQDSDSDSDSSVGSLASLSSTNSIVIDRLHDGGTFRITLDNLSSISQFCKKNDTIKFEDILADIDNLDIISKLDTIKKLENDLYIATTFRTSANQDYSKFIGTIDGIINETQKLKNPSESFLIINELYNASVRVMANNAFDFNSLDLETFNQKFSQINIIKKDLITSNEINCNCLVRVDKKIHNISNLS